MGSGRVGERRVTVNHVPLVEWVRIPPPQLGKKLLRSIRESDGIGIHEGLKNLWSRAVPVQVRSLLF